MTPLDAVAAAIRERLLAGQPAPLPGLGTLVRHHVSARIEEQPGGRRVLLPPGETVGLIPTEPGHAPLEQAFARFRGAESEPGDYGRAMDQIEGRLAATGEVRLPGVGLLRRTSGGVVLGVEADLLSTVNRTYEGLTPVRTDASSPAAPTRPASPPAATTPPAPDIPSPEPTPHDSDLEDAAPSEPQASPPSPSSSAFLDDDLLDEAFDDVLPVPFGSPDSPPLDEILPTTPPDHDEDEWAADTWTAPVAAPPPDLESIDDALEDDIEDADFVVVEPAAPEPSLSQDDADDALGDILEDEIAGDAESEHANDDVSESLDASVEDASVEDAPVEDAPVEANAFERDDLEDEPVGGDHLEGALPALEADPEPLPPSPALEDVDSTPVVVPVAAPAAALAATPAAEAVEFAPERPRAPFKPTERRRFPWVLVLILLLAILGVLAFEFWPRLSGGAPDTAQPSPALEAEASDASFTPEGADSLDLEDVAVNDPGLEDATVAETLLADTDVTEVVPTETLVSQPQPPPASPASTARPAAQRAASRSEPAIRPGLGQAPEARVAITPPVLVGLGESDRRSLSGRAPIQSSADAWTFIVLSTASSEEARRLSGRYARSGYRTSVIETERRGRRMYRVAIGQFGTRSDALRLRDRLPPQAPDDTWALDLQTL